MQHGAQAITLRLPIWMTKVQITTQNWLQIFSSSLSSKLWKIRVPNQVSLPWWLGVLIRQFSHSVEGGFSTWWIESLLRHDLD